MVAMLSDPILGRLALAWVSADRTSQSPAFNLEELTRDLMVTQ